MNQHDHKHTTKQAAQAAKNKRSLSTPKQLGLPTVLYQKIAPYITYIKRKVLSRIWSEVWKAIKEKIADHQTASDTDAEPTEDAESMVDAPSDYPDEQSAPDVPGDFPPMDTWPNDAL